VSQDHRVNRQVRHLIHLVHDPGFVMVASRLSPGSSGRYPDTGPALCAWFLPGVSIFSRERDGVARDRFGILEDEDGICYTRTGRRFFEDMSLERDLLKCLRERLDQSGQTIEALSQRRRQRSSYGFEERTAWFVF
jgi:PNKP adenylyltransferase domain, ligase domain